MQQLITKFYLLSEHLDDDYKTIVEFIIRHTHTKYTREKLMMIVENASYRRIECEIEEALTKLNLKDLS